MKSSTSWVMAVTPSQYFLPLFTKPNKNEAPSSVCINHQASSTTKILFLTFVLTIFQMYRITINSAMGFKDSSMSRIPKTIKLLSIDMFDRWLKKPAKVPLVYFLRLRAKDSAPVLFSKISSKSDIKGVFSCQVAGSDWGVISLI